MITLLDATLQTSAGLLIAILLTTFFSRASAAVRHRVLAAAVIGTIAAVSLQVVVPPARRRSIAGWTLPRAGAEAADGSVELSDSPGITAAAAARVDQARAASARWWLVALWLIGAAVNAAALAAGLTRLRWLTVRGGTPPTAWIAAAADVSWDYGLLRPVRLVQSDHPTLIVTWGWRRPVVILPQHADDWPADRMRVVLRHELAHIRRGDWPVQMTAELLRAVQWFNPLPWLACRRLRRESEYACDDVVIGAGIGSSEYATHLLDLARSAARHSPPWAPALAIARPSSLERRIRAMLTADLNRRPLSKRGGLLASVACLAVTMPVAAFTTAPPPVAPTPHSVVPPVTLVRVSVLDRRPSISARRAGAVSGATLTQSAFASFAGTLFDPFGGLLPGVTVTLVNSETHAKQEVHSDQNGRFEFVGLPAGTYTLSSTLLGFKSLSEAVTFGPGEAAQRDITLSIGSISETLTVTDHDNYPADHGTQRSGRQARTCSAPVAGGIGGNIKPPSRLIDVRPIYPATARDDKIEGTVIVGGRIDTTGFVTDLHVLRTPSADLGDAAVQAISQWQFEATQLNCVPIDTAMTVVVNFQLAK